VFADFDKRGIKDYSENLINIKENPIYLEQTFLTDVKGIADLRYESHF
jgi:hypothetical protein